ncbi:unnamed protein product, partial [Symbiodinium sp. CCMP2456]
HAEPASARRHHRSQCRPRCFGARWSMASRGAAAGQTSRLRSQMHQHQLQCSRQRLRKGCRVAARTGTAATTGEKPATLAGCGQQRCDNCVPEGRTVAESHKLAGIHARLQCNCHRCDVQCVAECLRSWGLLVPGRHVLAAAEGLMMQALQQSFGKRQGSQHRLNGPAT